MVDNTKKLYDAISSNGYEDLGDYNNFEGKLKDSGKREILYNKLKEDGFEDIGSLSDFNAKLGYPAPSESGAANNVNNAGKEAGFWDTWAGDFIERTGGQALNLVGGGFGFLDKAAKDVENLGLGTRGGMFGDSADLLKGYGKTLMDRGDRYEGKSFTDLYKEGNPKGAVGNLLLEGGAMVLPQIATAMATGGTSAAGLMGASVYSDKLDQLEENNSDMSDISKRLNAMSTASIELLSEKLSLSPAVKWLKGIYKAKGKEVAQREVTSAIENMLAFVYKKSGLLFEPVWEGVTEAASQLGENITNKVTGSNPDGNLSDGVFESFGYGVAGGAPVSAAGVPGLAKRQYDKIKTRKDYNNAKVTFEQEFKGDDQMLGIGSELESATPEEKVAFLEALEPNDQFTKSQKDALFNLVQSDIAYKSLRTPEAINEEKSERRELAVQTEMMNYDNAVAPITADNGMIQQVYINGDKEAPVYITKGNVVASQNENGELLFDSEKSDQSLYYRDVEGNTQVVSPSQVTGLASLSRLDDSRAQYEADLRAQFDMQDQMMEEQRRQEEAQEISNGDDVTYIDPDTGKQLKGKVADIMPGSEYMSIDIGDGNLSTVPKNITVKSAIQTEPVEGGVESETLDKTLEKSLVNEVVSPVEESKTSEITNLEPVPANVAEVQEQDPEPVLPVAEKSPIIMREDGTPDFIASGEGNTLDFLLEKYKDKSPHKIEVTKNALEGDLKKAYTALDKAQQNYDNAPIGKEDKAESALLQAQQTYDALKQEAEFWINLDKTIKEANIKPGDQIAGEIRDSGDPMTGEELAAMMLANGSLRLTRDSYERETGSGKEESKKMFGLFASPANGGVNIERAGELLMLADLENGTNFFDQNDPNAGRNAIIEVLSSARTRGDLIGYIKSNREAMAERERQAEYNDYAQWCEENYHLTPEDYEAYEADIRARAESITQEDIDYINGHIADEIQQINEDLREIEAILAEQNKNGNESYKRNDEGGTGGLSKGGDQLLQDEQSVQAGRIGETETEHQGTDGSINIENGTAQESPSERIKQDISDAEQLVDVNPTEAQKEAGNYKKGHVKIDGYDITIEQPAGSVRSGKDTDGKEWSVTMNNTYGYIRGTEGVDGDHIDIFLSESPVSGNVYVVDQVNADGSFDEHKVMYGFNSEEEVKAAYLANYSPGWKGLGGITEVSKDDFKKWIDSSKRKTKPFADYKIAEHKKEDTGVRFRKPTLNFTVEEQSIINEYQKNGSYLKAPNGKSTNLDERQWIQVRTEAFKNWFGDWESDPENSSKVVDDNGEPKVVYHGTRSKDDFYVFDSEKGNPSNQGGHYFSDKRNFASKFGGKVKEVFLDIKNPDLGGFDGSGAVMARSEYRDGGIFIKRNADRYAEKGTKEYIVFNPSQIKSATENVGAFDRGNDDIRFREVKNDEISSFSQKHNIEADDVRKYEQSMRMRNLGGASYAFKAIKRSVRLSNPGLSLSGFAKAFSPVKTELYEKFGDVDALRDEYIQREMEARNVMESARKRADEEAEAERKRLEEFELMPDEALDSAYFKAVEENDESRMRDIVNEAARRKGYLSTDEFRMGHRAPSYDEDGIDKSMVDVANNKDEIRDSLNEQLRMNRDKNRDESAEAISKALDAINKGERTTVAIYRAVPKSLKEGKVRNGDWVTLSESYAKQHGNHALDGNYRIMKEDAPAENLYWDGNDINEWGYDDKSDYKYKDVKNNRKLNDLITRDDKGDIIQPSKRFNARKTDPRFRITGKMETVSMNEDVNDVNQKFNEELQQQIHGSLPKGHVYQLGKPSAVLQAAGIPDLPIELVASKLDIKSSKDYESDHPYQLANLINLPQTIQYPIAVFDSKTKIGSKVVFVELTDKKGNNFVAAISTNVPKNRYQKNSIQVNSVRSVYPKDYTKDIVNWINRGDLMKYCDKNKIEAWITQQRSNSADVETQSLDIATKIVESFVNPTVEEGKILSAVDELSETLNTPVHIIKDVDDITDNDFEQQNKKRGSKGWYDPVTGEVYLVLPNAENVADAQATILHEVVAHKGLRGLLGESFNSTMESIFDYLPKEIQDSLLDEFENKTTSAEEYCAHMAETMSDPGIIQKICSAIKEALRKIGVGLKITDGDIMYMLWKSKNRLEDSDTAIESMNKILRDQKVKAQTKEYDTLFRSNKPMDHMPLSVEKKIDFVNDLQSRTERLYEGYVDRMIAVKKLQDLISQKSGKPIPDYMNVWMYENTLSSRNTYEISKFKEKHLNPLTVSLKKLVEVGLSERDIDTYVIAKHGLERNEYMRMKVIHEYVDNLKEDDIKEDLLSQIEGKTFSELSSISNEDLQDLVSKLSGKDYSGLTAIQKELEDQSIEDFISEIESEFKPEVDDLWKRIKAVNEFSLKKWFDSGMINRATYEKVKGMYKNYVPLRGFDETMAHDVYEYYTGDGSPFNNPLKTAEGRTSRAESPFPHLTSMAESSIVGGNKNLMKLHLYRLAQYDMASENPTGKLSITKQWYVYDGVNEDGVEIWKPDIPKYSDNIEQYRENIEKHAEEMALLESEGKATRNPSKLKVAYILLPAEANEHAIGVKLNGEFYQVLVHGNPKVAQAVEGLNDEARTNNKFVKAVAWTNRQMAANFTTRNPAFVASNLTRDLIWSTTALSVKEGGKYRNKFMRNIPKASGALVRKLRGKQDLSNPIDIMLNEFLENGGRTGYTALYSVEKYKKDIQNSIKTDKWSKTKKGYNAVLDFMQLPNEWAEDLSRFSTYMTSREEGRTILKSVADAKEVTVNFNRKGSGKYGAGVFRGLFLFFNAAVQSLNNAYGLTLKNPRGMGTALGGFGIAGLMIPSILSMLGSDDDREKYNGLPDYVRKNNLCIPLGWCGMDGFLKVPLPIELRAFYGIGDAVYRGFTGEDEWTDALCDMGLGLLDLLPLNPAGGTSNFAPDAFKPIVESYVTNKDFTGKPIAKITPFNEYDPEFQKVYRNTSIIPVTVSEYLNMLMGGDEAIRKFEVYKTISGSDLLNPAAIEHLFESYLGGTFTTLNQSFKTFVGAPSGLNDFSWRNVPVLNRFYDTGEVDGTMMKVNEKYFDYLDEMKEAQNVYRKYESLADTSPALESVKYLDKLSKYEEGKDWKRAEFIIDYAERINEYMDEIKESPDEKYKDDLQKEINLLKKEMVDGLKNGKVPE